MTEDVIERYDTFNTKGCPEDLIFGDFNDQSIPFAYSDLTNDYYDNDTQIDSALRKTKEWKMQSCQMMKTTMKTALLQTLTSPPNNILEIEGVERMGN